MAIEYFCCYHSYLEVIEQLNNAEKGRLFTACLAYSKTGEAPRLTGNERFVFPTIKAQIDRDAAKYADRCRKQSENARKRWDAAQCQPVPWDAADAKEKEKEKEKAKAMTKTRTKATTPLEWAGEELRAAFDQWLAYKSERREPYGAVGLQTLEDTLRENAARYGESAVAALVRECMASGWHGIIFDRLAQPGRKPVSATAPSQWAKDIVAKRMREAKEAT